MRQYAFGTWGVALIWDLRGSVIPKALAWAVPSAVLAALFHFCFHEWFSSYLADSGFSSSNLSAGQVWQSYNFLVGFLLTFRTGQAYSRWWEGGTLLQEARGEWFNAYSSVIAFSTSEKKRQKEVRDFHRLLATLMSLLYSSALYQISQTENMTFNILDTAHIDKESLEFLRRSQDKVEIVMQWVQRLIVNNMYSGIVPIPAPVISRVFQELSRGVVNVNNVRKISEFLFPFPYAQLISVMLLVHFLLTPILTSLLLERWWWASITSFISVFALWSLNYVAAEIECPFGDDDNDLPMQAMQRYMNRTLAALLHQRSQNVPTADVSFHWVDSSDVQGTTAQPGLGGLGSSDAHAVQGKKKRKRHNEFFKDEGEMSFDLPPSEDGESVEPELVATASSGKTGEPLGSASSANSSGPDRFERAWSKHSSNEMGAETSSSPRQPNSPSRKLTAWTTRLSPSKSGLFSSGKDEEGAAAADEFVFGEACKAAGGSRRRGRSPTGNSRKMQIEVWDKAISAIAADPGNIPHTDREHCHESELRIHGLHAAAAAARGGEGSSSSGWSGGDPRRRPEANGVQGMPLRMMFSESDLVTGSSASAERAIV